MNLKLSRDGLKVIDEHALKNFPRECCGLLLGKFGENVIEVEEVVEADNVLGSPVAFEADAELVFKTIKRAEKSGLELVGIYHSHPNIAAYVSARDSEMMKLWPGVSWLIVSAAEGRVIERKAYVLKDGGIEELEIIAARSSPDG